MKKTLVLSLGVLAVATLAGCVETATQLPAGPAGNAPEQAARAACLRDVSAATGNYDAQVLSSSYSEAGTEVIVGIGPQRAPWRCIAYRDGTTTGIMSLTNEGYL